MMNALISPRFFFQLFLFWFVFSHSAFAVEKTVVANKASTGKVYLENFLADTNTLQADFKQTLRSYDGEILQTSSGRFYLNRPGKFRWDYMTPYAQEIVSDGERLWIYDVDLEQVTVQKKVKGLSATPMALLESSLKLHEKFSIEELDNHEGIYRLKLSSRSGESDFGEIVVGLDMHGLRFLQLHDQFEQVTDIVFEKMQTNGELAAELFQFKPPPGVDIFGGS